MLDTKEKPVEGKVTEPAKQWTQRWYAPKGMIYCDEATGRIVKRVEPPGEHRRGTYPSRDVAEQRAIEWLGKWSSCRDMQGIIFLGAIEADEP